MSGAVVALVRDINETEIIPMYGKFEGCSKQWKNLGIDCHESQICARNRDEAQTMVAVTHYRRSTLGSDPRNSPTAGIIWDLKEKPGWS